MRREAGIGLKGPEGLEGCESGRRGLGEGEVARLGEICAREYRTWPRLPKGRGILFTCSHPQLPGPLRHTLNIRVHWCRLPLAGLGHSCGGLTRQAGLNLGSQEEELLGQEGIMGSKGRGASRRLGSLGQQPVSLVSLVLTAPARGPFTPFGEAQRRPGAG